MEHNYYRKNIDFTENESRQTVTISDSLLEKGLFREVSGDECKVLLYFLTHRREADLAAVEIPLTAAALGIDSAELKETISSLKDKSLLSEENSTSKEQSLYRLKLNKLLNRLSKEDEKQSSGPTGAELRREMLNSSLISRQEIAAALISFLPPQQRTVHRREEVKTWISDFELKMLKELVRRVNKWLERQGGGDFMGGAFAYLRAIIDSWYEEEITSYEKLQAQDKLYRETRELAQAYGINSFSSETAQLQTFQSWISGKQALSKELALAAIREAVRRKRDGQPSLKYVEDNFINPIKELSINNIGDFKRWLQKEMDHRAGDADPRDISASQKNKHSEDKSEQKQKKKASKNKSSAKKKTADSKNNKKSSVQKEKKKSKKSKENRNNKGSKEKKDSNAADTDYKWKEFFIDFDKYKE